VFFGIGLEPVRLSTEEKDEHYTAVDARLLLGISRLGTLNRFGAAKYG
jgi:hypothetical protein